MRDNKNAVDAKSPEGFFASGDLAAILPRIDVAGVGPLSFPVPAAQAELLRKRAQPRSKGAPVWQLPPSVLKIDPNRWGPILDSLVRSVREQLGLSGAVSVELSRLLIYSQGSFTIPQPGAGVLGLLLVVLPSWSEGGELSVSRSGKAQTIALTANEPSLLSWAFISADCLSVLASATAGYRVALVYNLLEDSQSAEAQEVAALPLAEPMETLAQGGVDALPLLESFLRAANQDKSPKETRHWQNALELSGALLRSWPREQDWEGEREAKMLSLLVRLQDAAPVKRFIEEIIIGRFYRGKENTPLLLAYGLLGPEIALPLIDQLLQSHLSREPEHCASLVFHLSQKGVSSSFQGIAQTLIRALSQPLGAWADLLPSGDTANKKIIKEHERRASFVVYVMRALWNQMLDYHADEAALCFLRSPQKFPLDGVLLPAVLQLKGGIGKSAPVGFGRLYQACLAHLQARLTNEPQTPIDYRRPDTVACNCRDCKELKTFLVDPAKREWLFKAAVVRREHVLESITKSGCDVITMTTKKSVPYILRCTKTNKSYERNLEQRREDMENLTRLS